MSTKQINFVVIAYLLFSGATMTEASEKVSGWGRVSMQGSIIDSACSIDTDSLEQTIDMDTIATSEIIRNGQGRSKSFSINLVNCSLKQSDNSDWYQFQITFDGDHDGKLFGVNGSASGVGLQIIDSFGNVAMPGDAMPLMDLVPGDMRLNYNMKLMANSHVLKAGSYYSHIRFKLDYF
ncbi:fimbrial protein [Klebsiella aerogenes]|uniref:fimbrial protein n=1 Tax=Klebsiella aerogenes TaxID=548 RepID=UPI002550DA5D|nr:fimbrial protein [Klebsiella aerogenes]MDK7100073.1 fimbrial protein [Klebsiella aerogenes]MDK7645556.1 fimbrial protein [Klebsiella aerogenes]MDK7850445.1 fimbrial protein [Klebsiella aerogenes]MDK8313046.1 fimbrial protein [Klebsiella aerogenes]